MGPCFEVIVEDRFVYLSSGAYNPFSNHMLMKYRWLVLINHKHNIIIIGKIIL
jgi:hypothetical protein